MEKNFREDIKIDFKELGCDDGNMDDTCLRWQPMAGLCKGDNEPAGSFN